jgi:mannan endo-1,4-beta-mannosidase
MKPPTTPGRTEPKRNPDELEAFGLTEIQRLGRHRRVPQTTSRSRARLMRRATIIAVACLTLAIATTLAVHLTGRPSARSPGHGLPTTAGSYIGLYAHGTPSSYAPVQLFAAATGVKPRVVVYYSGWPEAFQAHFAATVAKDGAVPLVQIDPSHVSIAAIAAGQYDSYLTAYAKAVHAYRYPVILSFGHEMNGYWYSWGYTHTPPVAFVAAWKHIVTLFRAVGARNVTWLWTVNNFHPMTNVPAPGPWWPGSSYVNWIGIDGYYIDSSSVFASVFGPTIAAVRALTHKPILITETSAAPTANQPAKISDLFAGVHLYGLLGFVWFDSLDVVDWRLNSPAAIAAFRHEAIAYRRPIT